jgi:malate dehydrogenase (oxaloacetate-decarboxylating)
LSIPVWHDDQQGSATALLAGLLGALIVVRKSITAVKIGMIGMGAANVSVYRLLKAYGVNPAQIIACDSQGTLHRNRSDLARLQDVFPEKWAVCQESNPEAVAGGIEQALRGADVCIAFSRSDTELIKPDWIRSMARDAIVFACANPLPEIWPWVAQESGARIVATGNGDWHNQVNNALAFPGIFRGILDAQVVAVTDEMALAAALELASIAAEHGLSEEAILPKISDLDVAPRVAAATALRARDLGLARVTIHRDEYIKAATHRLLDSRKMMRVMMDEHIIPPLLSASPLQSK